MNIDLLKKPFPENKIHWRVGATTGDKTKGIALAYIDARDVMDRLDEVCGAENWQVRHPREGYCEIGIKAGSEWVWKGNGAGETDYEGTKGQFSDSMKRAAVEWGVGRYLYGLPNEWVAIIKSGRSYKLATKPTLPDWATPNPKVKLTKKIKDEFFSQAINFLSENDANGFNQIWDEFSNEEKMVLWGLFNSQQRTAIKKLKED